MSFQLQACECGFVHEGQCPVKLLDARCPKCRKFMAGLWSNSVDYVAVGCCHTRYWAKVVEGTVVLTPRKQESREVAPNSVIIR